MVRDVTDRKVAEDKQVHLAEILEASTDYVATTDTHGRILYANGAFRRRFGIDTIVDITTQSYNRPWRLAASYTLQATKLG